jgi:peptide/nickel transport system permease protein
MSASSISQVGAVPLDRRPLRVTLPPAMVWVAPITMVAAFLVMALFPALFTQRLPDETDFLAALQPPSLEHLFGTDALGRDLFARVVYGARLSLLVGIASTILSVALGAIIGVVAGLSGGIVDRVISRLLDILLAFPGILLAMLTVVVLGPGIVNLAIAIGLSSFPGTARLVRSQVMVVARSGYVETAVTLGRPRSELVLRHVLPNSISPVLVLATIGIGSSIMSAAALSFIGLGAVPPQSEWGLLLADSRTQLQVAPWLGVFPGLVLVAAILSITGLGRLLQAKFEGK